MRKVLNFVYVVAFLSLSASVCASEPYQDKLTTTILLDSGFAAASILEAGGKLGLRAGDKVLSGGNLVEAGIYGLAFLREVFSSDVDKCARHRSVSLIAPPPTYIFVDGSEAPNSLSIKEIKEHQKEACQRVADTYIKEFAPDTNYEGRDKVAECVKNGLNLNNNNNTITFPGGSQRTFSRNEILRIMATKDIFLLNACKDAYKNKQQIPPVMPDIPKEK